MDGRQRVVRIAGSCASRSRLFFCGRPAERGPDYRVLHQQIRDFSSTVGRTRAGSDSFSSPIICQNRARLEGSCGALQEDELSG